MLGTCVPETSVTIFRRGRHNLYHGFKSDSVYCNRSTQLISLASPYSHLWRGPEPAHSEPTTLMVRCTTCGTTRLDHLPTFVNAKASFYAVCFLICFTCPKYDNREHRSKSRESLDDKLWRKKGIPIVDPSAFARLVRSRVSLSDLGGDDE